MPLGNKVKKRHEELGISQSVRACRNDKNISAGHFAIIERQIHTVFSFGSITCKSIENIYRRTFVHE